jgi:hypothetical protein
MESLNPINNFAALGFAAVGVVITLIGFGYANRIKSGAACFFVKILALLIGFSSMPALQVLMNTKGARASEAAVTYWVLMLVGYNFLPRAFGAKTSGFSLGWFVFVFCLLAYGWIMRTR